MERDPTGRRPSARLRPSSSRINDGHWVRYHSRYAVTGNISLLTERHAQKRRETEKLRGLTPHAVP
jgi:hypothetical protein